MKVARCYISDNESNLLSAGTNSSLTATSSGGEAVASTFTSSTTSYDTDSIAVGLATEIAANEIAHVKFLRAALTEAGATAVCMAYFV
jgi:hypothetical protein